MPSAASAPPPHSVFRAGGMIGSSPALAPDGALVFGARDRKWYCVGPGGEPRWVVRAGSTCDATPCVSPDGTVFLAGHDGTARAVSPEGVVLWAVDLGAPSVVTPVLAPAGSVLFADDAALLRALDPLNGVERWRLPLPGMPWGAAVSASGDAFVSAGDVVCVDADGRQRWRFQAAEPCVAAPAPGPDGLMVVGSWDRHVYGLDAGTGTVRWKAPVDLQVYGGAAIAADGTAYVGTRGGRVHAIAPGGRVVWTFRAGDAVRGTPALTEGGKVVFASDDGVVYALEAATGREVARHATGRDVRSSVLLLPGGRVAAGSWDFHLYVLPWSFGGPARAPWPQYQHDPARTGSADPAPGPSKEAP